MPHASRTLLAAATLAAFALVPSSASAAGFDCEASALRGTVLTAPGVEPVVANRGAGTCRTTTGSLGAGLPAPLTAEAVAARTSAGGSGATQQALAVGGVGDIRVAALPDLPLALPTAQLAALGAVTIPLPAPVNSGGQSCIAGTPGVPPLIPATPQICTPIPAGVLPTLPSSITVDLRPALQALLPDGKLPNVDLVRVGAALAFAGGRCADGKPVLSGSSQVAGISVLGQDLPVGEAVDQTLKLLDSTSIAPSQIDLSQVTLPAGLSFSTPGVGPILQSAVRGVLAGLPAIAIPETLAKVKVTPGGQTRSGETLTQRALQIQVSVAGQQLVDLVVGEAIARSGDVECEAVKAAAQTPTAAALACTKRRLVLTDVVQSGRRVRLVGAADRRLIGKRVSIVFEATGRTVARVKVRSDGSFSTTAPMPSRALRSTNRARYQAVLGRERSLDLKLQRRMIIRGVRTRGGSVTLTGRVSRPLGSPVRAITLTRRVSCRRSEVVKRFRPRADGTFSVTVKAPKGVGTAVYRLGTQVRKTQRNPKLFPTFTLPRAVALQ